MNQVCKNIEKTQINERLTAVIPNFAIFAQEHLSKLGFKSYFVGGIIRDYIISKEFVPTDIDIATNAT